MKNELLATECSYDDVVIDESVFNALRELKVEIADVEPLLHFMEGHKAITTPRIRHGLIGLDTEIGELWDAYKKHWFYHKPLDMQNVYEEIGDIIWYKELLEDCTGDKLDNLHNSLDGITELLGTTYDKCREAVIRKLKVRYPNKFTDFDAENRDTKTEMDAFGDDLFEDMRPRGFGPRED